MLSSAGPIHDRAITNIVFRLRMRCRTNRLMYSSYVFLFTSLILTSSWSSHQNDLQDQLISAKEICLSLLRVVTQKLGPRPSCYQMTPA
jgi:hypothetical protein